MAPSSFLSRLLGSRPIPGDVSAKQQKPPSPLQAVGSIMYRLHTLEPLGVEHELPQTLLDALTARLKFGLHVTQRTARVLLTLLLRTCVRHPLGWTIPQEVVCMLMYGILQSRQVPAWRAFFSGVGDLQTWCPVVKEKVTTGSCESWWVRLPPEQRPQQPQATINWLYLHGGAFVAGDALMYTQTFMCWLQYLAQQGIGASMLSVEYPLAPEHPFPAGLNAAADAIHWLLHDSGETRHYFVGGDSAGGNLALAALSLLRDGGKLSRPPLGVTLISPAVDLSNASVFGRREPVSSHFDHHQQQQQHGSRHVHNHRHSSSSSSSGKQDAAAGSSSSAVDQTSVQQQHNQQESPHLGPAANSSDSTGTGTAAEEQQGVKPSPGVAQLLLGASFRRRTHQQQQHHHQHKQQQQQGSSLESQGSVNVAKRQLEQQHVPLQSQPSTDCSMHAAHTAGGKLRAWQLLSGVAGELLTALRVHSSSSSSSSAREVAASGWFDYIPSDSFADELHCYLPDPQLLSHPLVSPTYAADVTGLCQAGMLVVAGGAELMRRDIQAFAAKAAAAAGGVNSRGGGGEAPTADTAAAAQGLDSTSPTEAEAAAAVLRGSDGEMGDVTDTAGQVAGSGTAAAAPPGDAGCRSSSSSSSGGCGCAGVSGFRVVYHEEPGEPHVYAMLMLPHLLQKGLVVPRFVAAVVKGQSLEEVVGRGSSSTPA